MSKIQATVQKNLRGFGSASVCQTCDNSRLVCMTVGTKNYIVEVDSCGNQVTEAKPLGTCSVQPNGVPFPLDENGNQIIDINEIDMDINMAVVNGSVITLTSEDGSTVDIDVCAIVAANCNSPMVINADGSVTYTDNAGATTVIPAPVPETVTTLVDNPNNTFTYTNEDGVATTVGTGTVASNGDDTATITDSEGNAATFCENPVKRSRLNANGDLVVIYQDGTIDIFEHDSDTLVVNPDGSVTHTAVNGEVQVIPAPTVSALAVAGSAVTHTNGDGVAVTFDICAIVAANCNSPMTLNPDGSVDYVDNAGNATTIPAPTNSALVADVAAGTFTHTSGDGVDTVVDVCALAQSCAPSLVPGPGVNEYTFNNGYGNTQIIDVNELDMDINSLVVTGSVVNFTAEDGSTGSFDICAIVAANCNSPMVVNADGSVSYTDNAGALTVIPAPVVTTLILNADGSATYTSENGTSTTIPAPTVSALVEDGGVVTHTNGDGVAVSFDICAIVAANCNSPMLLNADGSVSYTDNAGNTVVIPAPVDVQTPDGTSVPKDAAGNHVVTQCCVWTQEVNAAGNVIAPDGTASPAIDSNGDPIPAGTMVQSQTDVNGAYVSSECVIDDAVVSERCVRGSIESTYAKGDTFCHNARLTNTNGGTSQSFFIDSDTPLGPIPNSTVCLTFPAVKCGQRINLLMHTGYTGINTAGDPVGNAFVQFSEEFSQDGGVTWNNMQVTGGVDQVHVGGNKPVGAQSEVSFAAGAYGVLHVDTAVEYCTRIVVTRNQLAEFGSTSRVLVNTTNTLGTTIREQCC